MWRPSNPTSELDDIATDFLLSHGDRIPAEPASQTFRWQRWSKAPPRRRPEIYVPVASFLDIPRVPRITNPREVRSCIECRGRCMGSRCARCRSRHVREDFIVSCDERRGAHGAIFQAMISQAAWEGPGDDPRRVVVAPVQEDEDIPSPLVEAFSLAMGHNDEPEIFRELVVAAGFAEIIEARDSYVAARELKRAERRSARAAERQTPPPLLIITEAEAQERAADMLRQPRFHEGRRLLTRCPWTSGEYAALQILLRAKIEPLAAASALGRSPTSIAWRAYEIGLHLPSTWRPLLKLSKADARHL